MNCFGKDSSEEVSVGKHSLFFIYLYDTSFFSILQVSLAFIIDTTHEQ